MVTKWPEGYTCTRCISSLKFVKNGSGGYNCASCEAKQ